MASNDELVLPTGKSTGAGNGTEHHIQDLSDAIAADLVPTGYSAGGPSSSGTGAGGGAGGGGRGDNNRTQYVALEDLEDDDNKDSTNNGGGNNGDLVRSTRTTSHLVAELSAYRLYWSALQVITQYLVRQFSLAKRLKTLASDGRYNPAKYHVRVVFLPHMHLG